MFPSPFIIITKEINAAQKNVILVKSWLSFINMKIATIKVNKLTIICNISRKIIKIFFFFTVFSPFGWLNIIAYL